MFFDPTLRPYQWKIALPLYYAIEQTRGQTFSVMLPRQSGKNQVSAALVANLLINRQHSGGEVVVCAPTLYPQASISLERTVQAIRRQPHTPLKQEGNVLRIGRARATFLSASSQANVAGHTASLLLIADEAQDIEEDWFDRQFRPMTASTGANIVLFGTPWQGDSLLEKAAGRNRLREPLVTPTGTLLPFHHEFNWREIVAYNPAYGLHIEAERARLGEDHPIFQSQYEMRAALAERRLFSPERLAAIQGEFAALQLPIDGERYVAGLDFAGEGAGGDSTVLTIGRLVEGGCEVVRVERWTGVPFHEVSERAAVIAREWRLGRMVCDATGLGAPLTAGLLRELGSRVRPLVFSRTEKSALGFELLAAAGAGRLRIARGGSPGLLTLWDELRVCRAEPVTGGELRWSAPPGAHDDCVVSLALCLRAATEHGPARIAKGARRNE
jgi:hypothetical protein